MTEQKEIYKIIKEFPAYRISNKGNIQSRWKRGCFYSGFKHKDVWKTIPAYPSGRAGYLKVNLCDGYGLKKSTKIHTLVAKYFIGEKPKDKQLIRHLDSNILNNNVENLAYGTYVENEHDKIANGTWDTRKGGAKLTLTQVKEIRKKAKIIPQKILAKEYNVSRPTITRIVNYTIWKE